MEYDCYETMTFGSVRPYAYGVSPSYERKIISHYMQQMDFNVTRVAKVMQLTQRELRYKLLKYELYPHLSAIARTGSRSPGWTAPDGS